MAEDLDPSSSWGCKMHTFWRNDKSIYYETKPEYKGDPKPSQPQAASSGPFWYARGLLHYGTGWDGEKVPLWYLRMIYKNRAFMSRKPGWYQAQLRHYGVSNSLGFLSLFYCYLAVFRGPPFFVDMSC